LQDYSSVDLSALVPEIGGSGFSMVAIQRQPDTRVHCVRTDGTVAVLVYDPAENVICWVEMETDGIVEDVCVLPGTEEDRIYYTVKRTINSATVRYREKWALESECGGATLNKQADAFVIFSGSSSTITGLSHLEGEDVVVWADGKCLTDASGDIETFTVASAQITLTDGGSSYTAASAIVGLPYRARYKSTKLAYGAQGGTALTKRKHVFRLALILADTHARGIQFGPDFDHLDYLPMIEDGAPVDADYIWPHYDKDSHPINSNWDTDSRVCLEANAPRPATVLAMIVDVETKA
jgi:hypothetical protein